MVVPIDAELLLGHLVNRRVKADVARAVGEVASLQVALPQLDKATYKGRPLRPRTKERYVA